MAKKKKKSRRKLYVFVSLLATLSLTSALLLALAPAPLVPGAAASLFAVDTPQSMEVIFDTQTPATAGQWRYIYVHHSATAGGNALLLGQSGAGLGDHFLIGNGDGCIDGEIQIGQRWAQQKQAIAPEGVSHLDESCVGICLVGDFDHTVPTATQMRRLGQLVTTLQTRLHIPANRVVLVDQPQTPAGIGGHFPTPQFRGSLVP